MGKEHGARRVQPGRMELRLTFVHIQSHAAKMARPEQREGGGFIHDAASRGVDEDRALGEPFQFFKAK